mgnify:FL=1
MLSTAMSIQEVAQKSIFAEDVMNRASHIHKERNSLNDEEFASHLFEYSTHLVSSLTTKLVTVLLNETQLLELMNTIEEMEEMKESILGENDGE